MLRAWNWQRMHWRHFASLTTFVLTVLSCESATAQGSSIRARDTVASMQREADVIIQKFPRLGDVDSAIRSDCEAKNEGRGADSDFCRCASAVTISLWRSGIDPQMVPRLTAYLNSPAASAGSLLIYQGPELYRPMCTLAVAPSKRKR